MFTASGIENVIFRSIIKHGSNDEAVYGLTRVKPVQPGDDIKAMIAAFAGESPSTSHEHRLAEGLTALSITVNSGRNLYVIKLEGSTRATFGPGSSPIMTLPPKLGEGLFEDVHLASLGSDNSLSACAAADIPSDFADLPKKTVLTFICDRSKLENLWKSVMPDEHKQFPAKVPFFLNLYDTDTHQPVWTFLDPNQRHSHDDYSFKTHGGIHPGSAVQTLY